MPDYTPAELRPPPIEQKFIGVSDPISQETEYDAVMDEFGPLLDREDLRWRPLKPDPQRPDEWVSIVGRGIIAGGDGHQRQGITGDRWTLEMGVHPTSRKPIEVRRHRKGRSYNGEDILPIFKMDTAQFLLSHEPDPVQVSRSEYQAFLDEHRDLIDRELAYAAAEKSILAARAARLISARSAQENPHEFLAKAIGEGVAAALASMKGGKS